ncbi:cell division protein FtsX [Hippea alviniae]|uniref:cell division protein FtsX n=1 Tax=Hippea alviniae TaxID=1279027 RepID=UPI00047AE693|nr:permease-like cell division protein FtsX [Hippea alviniae]
MRRRDNVKVALFFIFVSFVLTMSILMSIFFALNAYVEQKKSQTPLFVFVKPEASAEEVNALINQIELKKGVRKVKLIDKDKAFNEMIKKFSIDKNLFSRNPFPYSIEVFFIPSFTTESYFNQFALSLNSDIVDAVKYPKGVLAEISSLHERLIYFSEVVVGVLYAVEFIVFLSIMTIFYSHRKFDYDTLKFFGIKRFIIFRMFLKDTIVPAVWGFLFSVVVIVAIYFVYDKYGDIPYISKELFKSSQKSTFALNILIGFLFTFVSSLIVFVFNDEKV